MATEKKLTVAEFVELAREFDSENKVLHSFVEHLSSLDTKERSLGGETVIPSDDGPGTPCLTIRVEKDGEVLVGLRETASKDHVRFGGLRTGCGYPYERLAVLLLDAVARNHRTDMVRYAVVLLGGMNVAIDVVKAICGVDRFAPASEDIVDLLPVFRAWEVWRGTNAAMIEFLDSPQSRARTRGSLSWPESKEPYDPNKESLDRITAFVSWCDAQLRHAIRIHRETLVRLRNATPEEDPFYAWLAAHPVEAAVHAGKRAAFHPERGLLAVAASLEELTLTEEYSDLSDIMYEVFPRLVPWSS